MSKALGVRGTCDAVAQQQPLDDINPKPIKGIESGRHGSVELPYLIELCKTFGHDLDTTPLPFRAGLEEYQQQAEQLLEAWTAGDPGAIEIVRHKHPRFVNPDIPWLPNNMSESDVRSATLELADAQLTLARCYDFESWPRLVEYVEAVTREGSPVSQFESAVEAVISGDVATLALLLGKNPELVHARATRVTHFDPPVHRATLLHYVAANRRRTPP